MGKYRKHPSMKLVKQIIRVTRFSTWAFERTFGFPMNTIHNFFWAGDKIPEKYWHLFYDPPETLRKMIERHNKLCILAQSSGRIAIGESKAGLHKRIKKKQEVKKIGVLEKLLT